MAFSTIAISSAAQRQQRGSGMVDALERVASGLGGFVAAQQRLVVQVADDGVEHRLRHQGCTGIIQVDHPLAARCLGASTRHIKRVGKPDLIIKKHPI